MLEDRAELAAPCLAEQAPLPCALTRMPAPTGRPAGTGCRPPSLQGPQPLAWAGQ